MRALFVMPVQEGSGETVTSMQVAQQLHTAGWRVAFLGSDFALRFVPPSLDASRWVLNANGRENVYAWDAALHGFKPDVVLFADYPLMLFNTGVTPLGQEPGWKQRLDAVDAALITFDHFGWAQQTEPLFLGPPHLGLSAQHFEPLPERLKVLRPCPMHDPQPQPQTAVTGEPFRSCQLPLKYTAEQRRRVRDAWLGSQSDRFLVFHSVPNWAWRHAERLHLALYDVLPGLLDRYFGPLAERITLVSSNNGQLLAQGRASRMRIINIGPLPVSEFENLLFGADLVLSENGLSMSIGKAVCAQQIAVVLHNSYRLSELTRRGDPTIVEVVNILERVRLGAVFPFVAFPTVTPADLDAIGIYRDNILTEGFARLEIFGGPQTAELMQQLLASPEPRTALHERQQAYIDRLASLDDVPTIVARVAAGGGRG